MKKILTQAFFERPVLRVAEDLVGKYLVRKYRGKTKAFQIAEVEAYDGRKDLACHASRGKTKRNQVMFGEAGRFYVYFTYGMHWMLNIVTGEKGYPAAILLRGVGGISGPGRLTKQLRIAKSFNGKTALPESNLWFEDKGVKVPKSKVLRAPRIGVGYAKEWAAKPYRFVLSD